MRAINPASKHVFPSALITRVPQPAILPEPRIRPLRTISRQKQATQDASTLRKIRDEEEVKNMNSLCGSANRFGEDGGDVDAHPAQRRHVFNQDTRSSLVHGLLGDCTRGNMVLWVLNQASGTAPIFRTTIRQNTVLDRVCTELFALQISGFTVQIMKRFATAVQICTVLIITARICGNESEQYEFSYSARVPFL